MGHKIVLRIAVPIPKYAPFDYLLPKDYDLSKCAVPEPGTRAQVPFGTRQLVGILTGYGTHSEVDAHKLRHVHSFLDDSPSLVPEIMALALRAANYYHHPEGEVLHAALPSMLRQPPKGTRRSSRPKKQADEPHSATAHERQDQPITLSPEQQHAVKEVLRKRKQWQPYVLHGIAGSGKTEVYLSIARDIVQRNQQVLILVPEVGLTPQIASRFAQHFGEKALAIVHSGLTPVQRYKAWQEAKAGRVKIIIGTRSAVFTATPHLGLIVVDEEHDISFKQQDGFCYSARDVALLRAQAKRIPIVLGSATPCLESMHNTQTGRYLRLPLSQRPHGIAQPKHYVIDTCGQKMHGGISATLMHTITKHIEAGNQVLLFLNRRGYAPAWVCTQCGWTQECPNCSVHLVFHFSTKRLHCHHCNHQQPAHKLCSECMENTMQASGVGTQRCERALREALCDTPIYRIDRDSMRSISHLKSVFERIQCGAPCVLIGTQMLAKGHHLPNVTLAAILDCDSFFYSTDFRASERFGQLVTQVAGRSGRWKKSGEVIIQTRNPNNHKLQELLNNQYTDFARTLLDERKQQQLPPFSYMALLNCEARTAELAEMQLTEMQQALVPTLSDELTLVGPIPPPLHVRAKWHRRMTIMYAKSRSARAKTLTEICNLMDTSQFRPNVQLRWSLDVDPQGF